MKHLILSLARRFALAFFVMAAVPAYANDHGGGGGGAPQPLLFTVNIGGASAMKFLQVEMVFEFAKPEAEHHLAELKPKVQHRIILLLSSEELASLQTTKGKLELQERIVDDMNKLLDETVKTGVKEVLFTRFIIQ